MKTIAKNIFLAAEVCKTRAWRMIRDNGGVPSIGDQLRLEEGIEIGKMAREFMSGGILISERNTSIATGNTRDLMNNPAVTVIYEAAFMSGACVARADIIKRSENGWNLYEVKSSLNDHQELKEDLAYTFSILVSNGVAINKAALLLVNRDYRKGMESSELFTELDCTDDVCSVAENFNLARPAIEEAVLSENQPEPSLILECKNCQYFHTCTGQGIRNHIFDLHRLSRKKFDELLELGIERIEDIPHDFSLTDQQDLVRRSIQAGTEIICTGLKTELDNVTWPAFYLDFETVKTALPLYPDTQPHEQIVTQYSIHKCSAPGAEPVHKEFLANPERDCRRELAEKLLQDLEKHGSIIVYTSFEKRIIRGLCKLFPDLAGKLKTLIARLVDLHMIIQENYYHPDFHGSTSIKKVLPVLVPGMSYDGLEIGEGDTAVAAFAYMALGKYTAQEAEKIKENLLKYCEQDTLAMVLLHKKLLQMASA